MFPIGLGMVELRSAFANDMSNLRTAGFPPPPGYYSGMPGALHGSSAMGHHPESSDMSAVAASVTGAGSLFTHHLNPGSLHHNHQSGDAGPFGILPHESVNLMNSTSGSTVSNHHSHPHSHPSSHSHLHSHSHGHPHPHSHPHGHPHASGPQNMSSHVNSSNNYNNKFCSIEDNNYYHHQHHHHKSNSSCSFGGMMQAMSQNVYSGAAAAAARNTTRSSFDHQFSKQLAHAHHQASDPYFNNFLMSDNYTASQYSSMNFPNSLARDFISFGNNSHSFKHSHSNSCSNQTRGNSSITGNNHLSSCSMMMSSLTTNNYCPNANLNSPSRSSSVASSHAIHHGSESSSCSYGYSSPSSIPHSPRQKRSSVSATPAVSFQNSTVISNTPASSGVQNYAGNSFTNTAYSTLGTPAGLSAYPTPPSSGNQQLPPQSGNTQDDSMRHFHVNSQNNGKSHQTNFNNSPYHPPKVSSGNNSSGHVISNSSCMVAAAAAAANSNAANVSVNYLQHNLKPIGNGDGESCLPNLSNLAPTISDAISSSNEINKVQINNTIDPLITNEPTLNSVFNGPEIEFPGEIEFAFNNLQSDILNGALGDQLFNTASRHSSHSNNSDHSNSCPQLVNSNESNDILMDRPQQPQVPLSSTSSATQPTMTTSSVSSCMVQSESVAVVNVPCVNDSILTNTCAISDDQITIKSTTISNSKGYQTDFIPNNQQRLTPPMTSDVGNDINNVENKLNNESGLAKKKKKSKESKSKIFCQQKMMQGQQSTCNKKYNSMINIVPIHSDDLNKISNKSLLSNTTCKSVEVTSVKKSGDLKDHEGKFFKMRPTTNTTITTLNNIPDSEVKTNFKGTKKRKLEDSKDQKSILDEYEFPDSPTHHSTKKVKKINLENSKKKGSEKFASTNSCSVTINKKVTLKSKMKVNQSFTGNTASTKLNISDKTEIINIISPRPSAVTQQLECNKIKIEEKVMKISGSMDKKQFNNSNMNNSNFHPNTSNHQSQKIHKDSSKVPSIIVQEILPSSNPSSSSLSQSSNKTITNTINIVSISKKSTPVSNQSKKELSVRSCVINNSAPTNTLTTIVPIHSNTLNASIIIANPPTTSNVTSTAITQPPQTHLQQTAAIQNQHAHHASSIKNLTNQNVLMQSTATNTPRRRSQDKKALTIREGLMRTGDFVVSLDETESELPMIWRIEGKSLLQRFEPSEQDGQIVYTNTSSYSAWNPTVKQGYTGVDVRIVGCNRTKIVVEKLGLTRNNINYEKLDSEKRSVNGPNIISNGEIIVEKLKAPEDKPSNNFQHQADFEVFIQTLISQALDANFISEIIKENDEYFLSHIQAIDDYCIKKKSRFFTKVKWDAHIVKCVEIFSSFNVIPQSQIGDLRCRLCHDNWSTQILNFTGKMYDQVTLETKEPVDIKQTKYAACDECKEKVALFSNLHHQKYNFFTKCREKVEEVRGGVEDKDSPMILEECLKDTEWMQSLFKQFEEICQSCDRIR